MQEDEIQMAHDSGSIHMDPPVATTKTKIVLVFFGLLVIAVFLEIGLRLFGINSADMKITDTKTGLRTFAPNSSIKYSTPCFSNIIVTNSKGFHSPEFSIEKPQEVKRIVIIGDSFVESAQVTIEKSFWHVLEQKLNTNGSGIRYEVIPLGIGGNGTLANFDYLVSYGLQYAPDLVINEYNPGDTNNDKEITDFDERLRRIIEKGENKKLTAKAPVMTTKEYIKGVVKSVVKHSSLVVNLYSKYLSLKSRSRSNGDIAAGVKSNIYEQTFYEHPDSRTEDAWQRQAKTLQAMKLSADSKEANFLLVSIADAVRVPPLRDAFIAQFNKPDEIFLDEPERRLQRIADDGAFSFFQMLPIFYERVEREGVKDLSWSCDSHYNETGNAWAADALFDYLQQHPDLLKIDKL